MRVWIEDEDGVTIFEVEGSGSDEGAMLKDAWQAVAADEGPLSVEPESLDELGDALAEAIGATLNVEYDDE